MQYKCAFISLPSELKIGLHTLSSTHCITFTPLEATDAGPTAGGVATMGAAEGWKKTNICFLQNY
jgi:hypothetical protein